ncbi:metallophosphoesterase [Nocardia jinanensis]|uniref:3',5'-cyclic adenosine monophosphate phosphodiesterase CpdA n=1 Tax=Nocardia jinanensis TaxID=382504 RepID=A0A917RUQ4_9NOCA|nr:metallophosphoesterase [Nocardia jinanensis]GGL35884.1 3',5'-cyclic adenosine monophosphate phosphodiesterase CpdA [Nocardia jinanensis]
MSRVTIVQLTDTHIRPAGERMHGSVDTYANLRHVLDQLRAFRRPIDALVLSGDLTDTGSPLDYRRLRDAVEPVAAELGAETLYVMGNHDEREAFAAELLDSPIGTAGPHDQIRDIAGLRVIALDSTTPHRHDGTLEPEQLDWLAGQLRHPARHGTLLVLHHPPVPSPIATTEALRLRRPERLAEVLTGSDVGLIICGHNHYTGAAALNGIPVWIGPAVSYRMDPIAPAGRHRGRAGSGYSRIDLVGSTLIATAIEATPAELVYDRAEQDVLAQLAALAAEAG